MGLIDSIVAAVSPVAAYKREVYRQAYDELRKNYDAGSYDGTNRNWRAINSSADQTDRYSRDNIRARARDLERNSDIMNSVIGAFKRNVVGGGYRIQVKTDSPEINKQIEMAWKKWCKKQNCDVTGTQSLNQMIRMAVERKKVDGGILFVKRYTREGVVPFQLQMIEVDELDTETVQAKKTGHKVAGGIEYDQFNKPVGYYIRQYDIDGYMRREPVYVEAKDVIFYFTKKRPSQLREISDMSPTIPRIRDVNEFITAVSVKERIEACLAIFIKKTLPTTGIGRGTINTDEKRVSYEGKTISPGMIKEMNVGDEIQTVNPSGQGNDATNFTKLQQRLVGAGQGISYEATSRDMAESTYSSARQGLIEDDLTYKEDKELLVEILDEIYETFVISAVLCGVISIPRFWEEKDKYLEHEWIQEPKPWIDPKKESEANMTALKTGQKTYKQIAAENGRDWRSQIDDMAEVIAYGAEKGVDMGGVLFGFKENETQEEPTDEDSGDREKSGKGE
ncbi:MAG: phage portal protein [Lachnospiraceae bacterium]|nr:phage portal protein [Lachnospiraceae bacterium]